MTNQKAYFFDMDGVLFDSMPHHAVAWEEVMKAHNLSFTARDCYINEGRTGESIIREAMLKERHREATPDEINLIYGEKSARFHALADQVGGTVVIEGVADVLRYVQSQGHQIWVVTGSGMRTLINNLNTALPPVFQPERMVTAFDVTKGKPDPEPIRSGKAAGLTVYAVNTGILTREDLAQADQVFDSMAELLSFLQGQ